MDNIFVGKMRLFSAFNDMLETGSVLLGSRFIKGYQFTTLHHLLVHLTQKIEGFFFS